MPFVRVRTKASDLPSGENAGYASTCPSGGRVKACGSPVATDIRETPAFANHFPSGDHENCALGSLGLTVQQPQRISQPGVLRPEPRSLRGRRSEPPPGATQ